ncbi:unnamed protein product [Arctia plantaginis]|uniref:Uncharacterized protein n=1 Tax=Arctia plantaginis TaxID=874455 RepID=A0A8S0ZEY9_ARCPL|nr:unnamed protein product [Arctia plantaginis]
MPRCRDDSRRGAARVNKFSGASDDVSEVQKLYRCPRKMSVRRGVDRPTVGERRHGARGDIAQWAVWSTPRPPARLPATTPT